MKAYLGRRYTFPASHRLFSESFSDAQNAAVFGKCANPHGHGHNYVVEVLLSGQVDAATGMVCNLGDLDGFIQQKVLALFDHTYLNLLPQFSGMIPSTENLCRTIYDIIQKDFTHARLEQVRIEETPRNSFAYAGGGEVRE